MAKQGDDSELPTASSPIERWKSYATICSLVAVPIVLGVGGWAIQDRVTESATQSQYVQIAVGILREPPESGNRDAEPLRSWAIAIVDLYSPVKFSAEVKADLLSKPLRLTASAEASAFGDGDLRTSAPAVASPSSSDVVSVADGSVVVLTGPLGTAVVEINNTGNCKAAYRWRHASPPYSAETSGRGELFEQYAQVLRADGKNHVTDVGGRLYIVAGPYKVQWSCGAGAGWIYGKPPEVVVSGTARVPFENFKFGVP